MQFNNIRMSVKLPVAIVTLSLIVTLVISWTGYRDFRASSVEQKQILLENLTSERAIAVETWFETLEGQLLNYASDPTAVTAIQGFSSTFGLLMDDPVADLQAAYIENNPNPTGQKDLLDRAEGTIPYNFQHENFHPVYRAIKNRLALYDLFLIDLDGNLVYSVYKEADFATNLDSGPYRDSGLAQAYRAARDGNVGQSYFADFAPYAPSNGAPAAFVASPIPSADGTNVGVLAIQLPADQISQTITLASGLGDTGEVTLIGSDGLARSQSRFADRHAILDLLSPNEAVSEALSQGQASYEGEPGLAGENSIGVARTVSILDTDWIILGEYDMVEVLEDAVAQRNKTLLFTAIAMMIIAASSWGLSRTFTVPLQDVSRAMQRISERDYDTQLPDLARKDEIGDLSRSVSMVTDRLREFDNRLEVEKEQMAAQQYAVDELGAGLQRLANRDFSQALDRPFAAEYESLRGNFNDTVRRLGETIASLKEISGTLKSQTDQIGNDSSELSQRTENQASTLEETAAAIDQITETIAQNSNELRDAEKLILETDTHVKQGRFVVESTTKAMDEIEKSSDEISSIIRVVDDIAFQTNLLALNAGVEAARAGDAGRGFAVVAAEVRQLAMRSTEAVSQIKSLIDASTTNVSTGVSLVRETESVLMEIVQRMEGISTVISSVALGADEQSSNISEINTGVNNLDRATQQNAMMVENTNSSVQALTQEAANVAQVLAAFRVGEQSENLVNMNSARFESRRSGFENG